MITNKSSGALKPPLAIESGYQPEALEACWYAWWEASGLFSPEGALSAYYEGLGVDVPADVPSFSIVMPPPNVTGTLHMGHALDCTIQDVFTRWHRMRGYKTLWLPGMDHAGIATQAVVERRLMAGEVTGFDKGSVKEALGKQAFLEQVWQWSDSCKEAITNQFKRLIISCDWARTRFTLDEGLSKAVKETFVSLYEAGFIYRGTYIVNWDPETESAISDIEVEYSEAESHLWHIAYPLLANGELTGEVLVVATTRPETLYGDVAVAVNPFDERYAGYIGQAVLLPLTNRTIPVIGDEAVDKAFGTGVLKITPAHDLNDFEVAARHGLEPVLILDTKASVLSLPWIPGSVQGLDRVEARLETERLLKETGALRSKEAHTHRVGKAQRSGAVIEPLLSKQWFVKTKPLAEACLKALASGELAFYPERWTKDYLRWMSDLQDWCISRQLWWGHAIPAWHHKQTGELYVGLEPPANKEDWREDPDVLDTWFSSGLWPFSTMGWPDEKTADYQSFYPTGLLVTGFDIIFFWVARMALLGHELTGQSPFKTVYIHGLVRDEKGQKMSKSKGNTIDPVALIDELGCDGFRFGLLSLINYGGQDIKLSKEKLEQGRLFANKLWHASRFVMMNIEAGEIADSIDPSLLNTLDVWVLARYEAVVKQANAYLAGYRLGEYASWLLQFVWYEFCDWYVEYAKAPLRSGNDRLAANTRAILLGVLEGVLGLLHPVMPVITEVLWQSLPNRKAISLSVAPFAQSGLIEGLAIDEQLFESVDYLLEVVKALRHCRQQYGVSPSQAVSVYCQTPDALELSVLKTQQATLNRFVPLETLTLLAMGDALPAGVAVTVAGQTKVMVSLEGLIDWAQERERLTKKRLDLEKDVAKLNGLLNNAGFMAKAPEAVVVKNREQLAVWQEQLRLVVEQLSQLP
jgi:valyl-tRNA synthetase